MLNFEIRYNSGYKYLKVQTCNGELEVGLLNEGEQLQVVLQLLYAAERLLPEGYEDQEDILEKVRTHCNK